MSASDLLTQIARARATMMLRGVDRLVLTIGPHERNALGIGIEIVEGWPEVMAIEIDHGVAGWLFAPEDRHPLAFAFHETAEVRSS